MNQEKNSNDDIWLVYDGDCPFCRNFSRYVRIRESAGTLHLVNAREPSQLVEQITEMGLDLDEGMVVKVGDNFYHGADAMHILSFLSSRSTWFNRLSYWSFKSKAISHFSYPIFRSLRNLLLRIRGVAKIDNLNQK